MAETNWRELCRKLVQHAATAQLVLVGEGLWDGDEDDGLLERARAAIEADELAVIEHIIGADVVTARIESNDGRLVTVSEVARPPLSPAAQAVLDACDRAIDREMTSLAFDPFREPLTRDIAAAALRAAVERRECDMPEDNAYAAGYYEALGEVEAIAAELEVGHG